MSHNTIDSPLAKESILIDDGLKSIDIKFHYYLLEEGKSYIIKSPIDGFLNILFRNDSNPCISPYYVNNKSYILRGGENIIHLIKEGETLEWKNSSFGNWALIIFIPSNYLYELRSKFQDSYQRFENGLLTKSDSRLLLNTNQIIDYHIRGTHLDNLRIQALLIEMVVHQIEGLFAENAQKEVILNKNHYEMILRAKAIIDADLSQNHTIQDLAKQVGTNEQYLKKYFKQHVGKTIMTYITECKMQYAKELIMTGNHRVADVARMTGYKHATHFTTAFKKYYGFIPNSLKYTFLIAQQGAQILTEIEQFITIL